MLLPGLNDQYGVMMSEPVTIIFTHREKEYVAATRLFYARVYHTRFLIVISSIVLSLGLGLFVINVDFLFGTVAMVVGLILLVINLYAYFVTPAQHFRRNAKFQEEYDLRFSEDGLLFRSKNVESKLKWSFYSKTWETPNYYFLFYDKGLFTLIPKRVFTSERQQWAFQDLLRRKIGANVETPKSLPQERREFQTDQIPPQSPADWR
jgi:hypothetical protein